MSMIKPAIDVAPRKLTKHEKYEVRQSTHEMRKEGLLPAIPPAPKIGGRVLQLVPINFKTAEEAIDKHYEVVLTNAKKGTVLRGYIIDFVDRDEGKEVVLFRSGFRKKTAKVPLTALLIEKKGKK